VKNLLWLVILLSYPATGATAQDLFEYRLLATSQTSTMEEELNEASEAGFRIASIMGGETAFGGDEALVIMSRPEGSSDGRYQYKLLATTRTSTMQKELQEAGDAGYVYVGQTVFRSFFGGDEVTVVLERDRDSSGDERYEYLLLATSRTSTMQDELQEAGANGFALVGMTVGETSFGGDEVVAILRRYPAE
jgi:hypothetical protein